MIRETKVRRRTLAERKLDGELDGYDPGPRPGADPANIAIDREVAWDSDCDACGHHGQEFRPFHSTAEHTYRCYTLCPDCGHTASF